MKTVTRWIALTDLLLLLFATSVVGLGRFGADSEERTWGQFELTYPQFGILVALGWWWALSLSESRDPRILGEGVTEYRRIGRATAYGFGALAVGSVAVKLDFSRSFIGIALPIGLLGLLLNRWLWRQWILSRRTRGQLKLPIVVAGRIASAGRVDALLRRNSSSGYSLAGIWDLHAESGGSAHGLTVPVFTGAEGLHEAISNTSAQAVFVTDPESIGSEGIRHLSWTLDGVQLMVLPHFVDVAPERVKLRYVAGEPVLVLEEPQFARAGGLLKALFDRCASLCLIVALSPVLIVVALAVKLTSPGPVMFRHRRIGKDGLPFTMYKFRSMRNGTDSELDQLLAEQGRNSAPLFKPTDDPRITPVGRFIRRYSIDELPQLLNVLLGTMSLVGPRPQVPEEVALYEGLESTRLKVLPGLTGMWQVSGRSNLDWQEAARLDLYYVENWSMLVDMIILMRTVRAVLIGDGAR